MNNPNIEKVTAMSNNISVVEMKNGTQMKIKHIYDKNVYNKCEIDEKQIDWIVYKNV